MQNRSQTGSQFGSLGGPTQNLLESRVPPLGVKSS